MSNPVTKEIDIEKLREWRARLAKIVNPLVTYSQDHSLMQTRAIQSNALIAEALIKEIEKEMGAYL